MAISRKKTGVARTMTWLGDIMPDCHAAQVSAPLASTLMIGFHRAVAQAAGYADHEVVQVHGGSQWPGISHSMRPMRGHALAGAGRPQDAVLVAAIVIVQFAFGVQRQHLGRPESMAWLLWPASQTA